MAKRSKPGVISAKDPGRRDARPGGRSQDQTKSPSAGSDVESTSVVHVDRRDADWRLQLTCGARGLDEAMHAFAVSLDLELHLHAVLREHDVPGRVIAARSARA